MKKYALLLLLLLPGCLEEQREKIEREVLAEQNELRLKAAHYEYHKKNGFDFSKPCSYCARSGGDKIQKELENIAQSASTANVIRIMK